jgi:predicted amidohydrolase
MLVAAIQHDIEWADRQANYVRLEKLIREAAQNGASFIVLSEMFSTGFVVDRDDIGEPEGGPSSQFLSRLAVDLGVWICGSCPETATDDPRPYNSLVVASPDASTGRYRKIHPFTYGGEDKYFRAGSDFLTVEINGLRTTFFVCYDLRFADEFWATAHDTDLYVIPANWPVSRREHWLALLRARAIENQAYVIGCNRVGTGGGLEYVGDSRIFDPLGNALAEGGDSATILYADVTSDTVAATRAKFPFLQDRR